MRAAALEIHPVARAELDLVGRFDDQRTLETMEDPKSGHRMIGDPFPRAKEQLSGL